MLFAMVCSGLGLACFTKEFMQGFMAGALIYIALNQLAEEFGKQITRSINR